MISNRERQIVNDLLRGAFNILRVQGDKHAEEIETVIKSIESDIWETKPIGALPSFEEHAKLVRESVYAGSAGDTP
jgi:hypothetical protein